MCFQLKRVLLLTYYACLYLKAGSYIFSYLVFIQAIRRNNVNANAAANVPDIPPNLVNPEAVELVLDIRREYARKLDKVILFIED